VIEEEVACSLAGVGDVTLDLEGVFEAADLLGAEKYRLG
jgi:hypothetical protein